MSGGGRTSICGLRSSSTFWRVSCFSTSVSFAAVTVPTLNLRCFAEKSPLYENVSFSSTLRPFGSLFKILNFAHAND